MRTLYTRWFFAFCVLLAFPLGLGVALQAADLSHVSNYNIHTGYRGMVAGDFDTTDVYDELLADYGPVGVWLYQHDTWTMVSQDDPEWMFAVKWGSGSAYQVVADFGAKGLWVWSYPGTWSQLTTATADGGFAVDDDGDGKEEIQIVFYGKGLWRYDNDDHAWIQLTPSYPMSGIRCDLGTVGVEEGLWRFTSGPVGLWIVEMGSGHPVWRQLSSSPATADMAAANFIDNDGTDSHDELIVQFSGLGTWLYDGDGNGTWQRITSTGGIAMIPVKTGAHADWDLLFAEGGGHPWMWYGTGAGEGWHQLSGSAMARAERWDPDALEAGEFPGETELAADFGFGLWMWNRGVGTDSPTWTQLTASDPAVLVAWDYYGDGAQTSIVVNFGAGVGLWRYDGVDHRWLKMSNSVPQSTASW